MKRILSGLYLQMLVALMLAVMPGDLAAALSADAGSGLVNSLGMKFVNIPGENIAMCIWETRVRDFTAFVDATRHDATTGMVAEDKDATAHHDWREPGYPQTPDHPASGVSFEDAQAFCRWLTDKERAAGLIGMRQEYALPTDRHWSVAAGLENETGATPADNNRKVAGVYPWGSEWPPAAEAGNYAGQESGGKDKIPGYTDRHRFPSPVGAFPPNRHGLHDLGGNLWEWTSDWYDGTNKAKVRRGGSWLTHRQDEMLTSARRHKPVTYRGASVGFRCILTAAVPAKNP